MGESSPRRPVSVHREGGVITVVCDDGSVWVRGGPQHGGAGEKWHKIDSIPGSACDNEQKIVKMAQLVEAFIVSLKEFDRMDHGHIVQGLREIQGVN